MEKEAEIRTTEEKSSPKRMAGRESRNSA